MTITTVRETWKRYIICSVRDTIAIPVIGHHRTRTGAISYAKTHALFKSGQWVIVLYPGFAAVYNSSDTATDDLDLKMTVSYVHRV